MALAADDPIDDVAGIIGGISPIAPDLVGKGLSWVGHKVGDWLGLTGTKREVPV